MIHSLSASIFSLALAIFLAGCQSTSKSTSPPPASTISEQTAHVNARPMNRGKPLIDFGRGAGGFPLADDSLPESRDGLIASLASGYLERISMPGGRAPVAANGENYPKLDSLEIDLTGGQIKPAYRPSNFKALGRMRQDVIHVDRLSYTATPLKYIDGSTSLRMSARDVSLALLRGKGEQAALVMTDAKDGVADFEVSLRDLRAMFLASARTNASRSGYSVRDVKLKLASDDSRSLTCALHVSGFWLLLPTSFRITGRIDVDANFNAHLSKVGCSGEDVGGVLIAGFIDAALKKYNGRVMPLAAFPGGQIRITDLDIQVDDSLRVLVSFGSCKSAADSYVHRR